VGEDEPYFIELQHPASTRIVLSADCAPEVTSPTIGALYASDTSLLPDGKTRALGTTRDMSKGGVAYVALGHCHNLAIHAGRAVDPMDTSPLTFRDSWEPEFFTTLLKNASPRGPRCLACGGSAQCLHVACKSTQEPQPAKETIMPRKEIINLGTAAPNPNLSPATRFGNLVFVAGQTGRHPVTGEVGKDIREQTRNVLERIKLILAAAGTSLDNVLTATTYVTRREDVPAYNEEYAKYFPTAKPARTTVTVASLNSPELVVEITVTACIPD
jgi:enamine deaminase RidA (YjgF/YER057c/UK114 family)